MGRQEKGKPVKPETVFKQKVQAWLRTLPQVWAVKVQQVGLRGTPDILACVRGQFVALELKRDAKAKIDTLQVHNLRQIATAGGFAAVVYPENFCLIVAELGAWVAKRNRKGVLCGIDLTGQAS
jgi:hypothetical protein